MLHVIGGRAMGPIAVVKKDGLAAILGCIDPNDVPHPVGVPSREINQDAVERIAPLKIRQGATKTFAGEPQFRGLDLGMKQIMADGQLAHDRDPIHRLMPHGRGQTFFAVH
jgi:hypothetical protein